MHDRSADTRGKNEDGRVSLRFKGLIMMQSHGLGGHASVRLNECSIDHREYN